MGFETTYAFDDYVGVWEGRERGVPGHVVVLQDWLSTNPKVLTGSVFDWSSVFAVHREGVAAVHPRRTEWRQSLANYDGEVREVRDILTVKDWQACADDERKLQKIKDSVDEVREEDTGDMNLQTPYWIIAAEEMLGVKSAELHKWTPDLAHASLVNLLHNMSAKPVVFQHLQTYLAGVTDQGDVEAEHADWWTAFDVAEYLIGDAAGRLTPDEVARAKRVTHGRDLPYLLLRRDNWHICLKRLRAWLLADSSFVEDGGLNYSMD